MKGQFLKGMTPWNKGIKTPIETIERQKNTKLLKKIRRERWLSSLRSTKQTVFCNSNDYCIDLTL